MNACCQDPANLGVESVADGLVMRVCRVCDSRHYEITVDPASMGVSPANLEG